MYPVRQCSANCSSGIGSLSCCFVSKSFYIPSQPGLELFGQRVVWAFSWLVYIIICWTTSNASDYPQSTIPPALLVTRSSNLHRGSNSVAMMELNCPLDSVENLQSARKCKPATNMEKRILWNLIQTWSPGGPMFLQYHWIECVRPLPYIFIIIPLQTCINFITENSYDFQWQHARLSTCAAFLC